MRNKKYIIIILLFITAGFLQFSVVTFAEEVPPVGNNDNTGGTIPDTIFINLDIEGPDSVIFKGDLSVSACSPEQISLSENLNGQVFTSSTPTISAYCAILQSGISNTWTSFGDDQFLDSINGVSNDFVNNHYWTWFNNLEYGQTALNKHNLFSNENLLITISRMPLKISVSTTTSAVGATTTISVLEFGFDSSFNGIWSPASLSSISINSENFETNNNGVYDFVAPTLTPFVVVGHKTGFLDTSPITLYPVSVFEESTTTPPVDDGGGGDVTPSGGGGGGGGGMSVSNNNIDIGRAIQFLADNQQADGSFGSTGSPQVGSSIYTDWVAIALASGSENQTKEKIKKYLKDTTPSFNSITDYERHAMALMSLGINPYDGTAINYIKKISDSFDGFQIGDKSLINDDIFAIFPLMKSGYLKDDLIIQKIISFLILKQDVDGSWEKSVDLTASAIQALSLFTTLPEVNLAINKAKVYLVREQKSDAGFGSSFSTSWVIQAITAMLDSNFNWIKNYSTPNNYLYLLQQGDGGIELMSKDKNTRIWATAYAIPASLNKTWYSILTNFPKPKDFDSNLSVLSGGGASVNLLSTTTTATSTISIEATSTLAQIISATSSDMIIDQATTSATSTLLVIKIKPKLKSSISKARISSEMATTSLRVSNFGENVALVGVNENNIIENILAFFAKVFKKIRFW